MKQKIIRVLLAVSILVGLFPVTSMAAYEPPASFGAPTDLNVTYYSGHGDTYEGFEATVTASSDLRAFVDEVGTEGSVFNNSDYKLEEMSLQLDYKTEDGDWHHASDWDSNYTAKKSSIRIEKGVYTTTTTYTTGTMESISDGEKMPETISYFNTHTWQFRARFLVATQTSDGEYHIVISPWSSVFSFSNNKAVENPDQLINHAPVLKSAEVKYYSDGRPYLQVISEPAHADLSHLNSITSNNVTTEVYIKTGSSDWQLCNFDGSFTELFNVDAINNFFGTSGDIGAAMYQIKMRYKFNYAAYPAAGRSDTIYSPYSNVISHGLPAYSASSVWAKAELDKANADGLIPDILKGADMTKPITREEFAELALALYEKTTGKDAAAAGNNPFSDTTNSKIVQAYDLGIVQGISSVKFAPKDLTNREQVAAMLSRTIRIMAPGGDFSVAGAPTFSDQKNISSWALEHVQFMAKMGIINGTDGKFMPKAVTTTEKASGYATATREQALAMSVRIFEKYK